MSITLPHWTVFWRQSTGITWTDLSEKVNYKSLEWTDRLSEKVSFNVALTYDKDDGYPDIQPGDFIAICKDSSQFEIADNILVGIVDNPNKDMTGFAHVYYPLYPYYINFNLECTGWDFSEFDINTYEYKQTAISTIIEGILSDSQELLGGVINGVTIPKYSLKCPSFTVDSFNASEKTAYEAIEQLCNENGLYFKLIWFSSPNITTGLNLAAQLLIFDDSGLQPKHPFWNDIGINDSAFLTGRFANPNYNAVTNPNVAQYVPTIKKPKIKEDQSNIRNYLVFDGYFSEAGAFDGSLSDLIRYETTAQGVNNDTYYLPHPAFDIYSGGFLVSGYVTTETVPSTTQFSINSGLSGSVVIGDKIVINKGTDIRTVSGVSGNLITVSVALPSAPVANDLFEVIQQDWITIYDENENTAVYSSRGFAKDLKLDQPAKIRWLADRSIPPPGTTLVYYYWPAKPYKRIVKLNESIAKYGLKRADIKSDSVLTKTQIDSLLASFENQTPNKTLELSCYLPAMAGDMIPISITEFCNDKLMVNETRGKYGGVKKYELINSYEISLSDNYKEDFNDLLGRLTTKANFKNSGADNKLERISERISVNIRINSAFMSPKIVYARRSLNSQDKHELFMANLNFTEEKQITNTAYQYTYENINLYSNYLSYKSDKSGSAKCYLLNLKTGNEIIIPNAVKISRLNTDFNIIYYSTSNNSIYKYDIKAGTSTLLKDGTTLTYSLISPISVGTNYIYYSNYRISPTPFNSQIRRIEKSTGIDSLVYSSSSLAIYFIRPNYAENRIAFSAGSSGGLMNIYTITTAGGSLSNRTNAIVREGFNYPVYSFDDTDIYHYYRSDFASSTSLQEIWKVAASGSATKTQIKSNLNFTNVLNYFTFDIHYAE